MEPNNTLITGKYSAILAGTEISLGSLLHMWHIPFSGHLLSLNQGFILCKAAQKTKMPQTGIQISIVVATLKSLSPVGKRLTPMLAISAQGFLFSLGQLIFGVNILGSIMGMILLSLWTYFQMVLIYLLTFGIEAVSAANYFVNKLPLFFLTTSNNLLFIFSIVMAINLLAAIAVAIFSHLSKSDEYESYLLDISNRIKLSVATSSQQQLTNAQKIRLVCKDLLRPWFLLSLLMIVLFLFVNDSSNVVIAWYLLRTAAVSFIVFYSLRFFPIESWFKKMFKTNTVISTNISYVLQSLKDKK
jgi:hypothetical protein